MEWKGEEEREGKWWSKFCYIMKKLFGPLVELIDIIKLRNGNGPFVVGYEPMNR